MGKLHPSSQSEHIESLIIDKELSVYQQPELHHLHLSVDVDDDYDDKNTENAEDRLPSSPLGVLTLVSTTNAHHPIHWPAWKKWCIVAVYSLLQIVMLAISTSYTSASPSLREKFGGSKQIVALGQSMFIIGNAVGPPFLGPLSDIGGRKWVYVASIAVYGLFQIGCALATNLPMMIIFMLLSGIAGSTAMSNVCGTIADLFGDADNASQPLGFYVLAANAASSVGGVIGECIIEDPRLGLSWVFWINVIMAAFAVLATTFTPETLPRLVISRSLRGTVGNDEKEEKIAQSRIAVVKEIRFVATMAFKILFTEPIVLCLGLFNGYIYGLLFLYLYGISSVFVVNNGLSVIGADLTYLNLVVAVIIMFIIFVPIQTALYRRDRLKHGVARPEARFLICLFTVWGFPISLFWFAFTSSGTVSYWSPVVAGAVMGVVNPLLWLCIVNYITDSYQNVAGSAIAAFLIPTQLVAAGCVHTGVVMFDTLSTTWAFIILALVSLGVVASVYVVYFWGSGLRKRSRLAMDPSEVNDTIAAGFDGFALNTHSISASDTWNTSTITNYEQGVDAVNYAVVLPGAGYTIEVYSDGELIGSFEGVAGLNYDSVPGLQAGSGQSIQVLDSSGSVVATANGTKEVLMESEESSLCNWNYEVVGLSS